MKLKNTYLCGAHGALECGEAIVEGSQNGYHGVSNRLALPQALAHELRPSHIILDTILGPHHGRILLDRLCFLVQ